MKNPKIILEKTISVRGIGRNFEQKSESLIELEFYLYCLGIIPCEDMIKRINYLKNPLHSKHCYLIIYRGLKPVFNYHTHLGVSSQVFFNAKQTEKIISYILENPKFGEYVQ